MGSTLEHGIYLPSEGEKNCYQGLASNWNKVDGALGDVAELKQLIENKFTKEVVTELPTEDINPYCIYMILKTDPETNNIYDEWVYINNAWEYLGNTQVDMTQYYTKQEVNQLPAVASGVTSTKVGNYDTHIADTNIHVTANDKTKWTNSANTHVLRLALSALTPSTSDNSFSNLDDSTALKVGDKVMDTAGVLFSITAIDTANSTFTIGTALIDLAQDSDVVHKSGNETISGVKTITDTNLEFKSTSAEYGASAGDSSVIFRDKNNLQTFKIYSRVFFSGVNNNLVSFFLTQKVDDTYYASNGIQLYASTDNKNAILRPILANNNADGLSVSLGDSNRRWQSVYANNYYYGSDNVEFSTKFVTTDTNQTISGNKTFSGNNSFSKTINSSYPIVFSSQYANVQLGEMPSSDVSLSRFDCNDKNNDPLCYFRQFYQSSGTSTFQIFVRNKFANGTLSTSGTYDYAYFGIGLEPDKSPFAVLKGTFNPFTTNTYGLGTSTNKWKTFNGLTPSSLSLPDIDNKIDISSYVTDLTGVPNEYTPQVNGWICVRSANATKISILDKNTSVGTTNISPTATYLGVLVPCIANRKVNINIICTSLEFAYFMPCLGNV